MIIADQSKTINKQARPTTASTFWLNRLIIEAINIRQSEAQKLKTGSIFAGPATPQNKRRG